MRAPRRPRSWQELDRDPLALEAFRDAMRDILLDEGQVELELDPHVTQRITWPRARRAAS